MKSIARNDRRTHTQLFSLNLIRAVAIVMVVLDHPIRNGKARCFTFILL